MVVDDGAVPALRCPHVEARRQLGVEADLRGVARRHERPRRRLAGRDLGDQRRRTRRAVVGEPKPIGGAHLAGADPFGGHRRHGEVVAARLQRVGEPGRCELLGAVGDRFHLSPLVVEGDSATSSRARGRFYDARADRSHFRRRRRH